MAFTLITEAGTVVVDFVPAKGHCVVKTDRNLAWAIGLHVGKFLTECKLRGWIKPREEKRAS